MQNLNKKRRVCSCRNEGRSYYVRQTV